MKPSLGSLLVVDDEPFNRDLLCRRLERRGYSATEAPGGKEALALLAQRAFDLVLLDITMPELDGFSVLKQLRLRHSAVDLPVIMVTAKSHSADIVEALKLGANDYVTKPIDFPVALARIDAHLSRKRAEDALRESEERYAIAMRGANDGIWDWHMRTHEVYFSPRWHEMVGYAEGELQPTWEAWLALIHPEDQAALHVALQAHIAGETEHFEHEHRVLHRDGTYRWVLCRGLAVRDATGQAVRMAGSQTDITGRKVADALTGLPNRVAFRDHLEHALTRVHQDPSRLCAVLFVGLDRFRGVNESLGHAVGDQLLTAMARRLEQSLSACALLAGRGTATMLARVGGDEFAVLLEPIQSVQEATDIATDLQQRLAATLVLSGHEVFLTASIGIALSATGYQRSADMLRDAETAMARAKTHGAARQEVFDTAMYTRAVARLRMETDLRRALERQEFHVFYQPIVALSEGRIAGFEALVRWQPPQRGLVPPNEFIPLAEETELIIPLGTWVLQTACRQVRDWQQQFPTAHPLFMSVNFSGKQFAQPNFVEQTTRLLHEIGLETSSLKLEITETVLIENAADAMRMLAELQRLGIQLSLDDFGTGYSSLSHLHRFPMQTLKIDQSFINRLHITDKDTAIVRTILALACNLDMDVVAEGVETPEQLAALRTFGCKYGQGYLFSKPVDVHAATAILAATPRW